MYWYCYRHVLVGFFYGSIFYNLADGNTSTDYTNRLSLIFFSIMFLVLGHQQAIPELFENRLVFYRERGARAYGAVPYWLSCWYLHLPQIFLNTLIFCLIVYYMAGLNTAPGCFGYFWGVLFLTSTAGMFMAQLIASLVPSAEAAISVFPIGLFFSVAFAGYIVYLPNFEHWLGWYVFVFVIISLLL